MTVGQLIALLQKMPANSQVVASVRDGEMVREVEMIAHTPGWVILK